MEEFHENSFLGHWWCKNWHRLMKGCYPLSYVL